MKKIPNFILPTLFLFCLANLALAQEVISGGKAKDYVGEFSKKFSAGTYTIQVLTRNLSSPSTQGKIDGIIFNAQSGSFRYIRRSGGNHIIILLSYKKNKVDKISADNSAEFEKIIKDNKLVPYVLPDKDSAELAIIYAPHASVINASQRKDKSVYLEIQTPDFRKNSLIRERQNTSK